MRRVQQASVEYVMPPLETQPPHGLTRLEIIEWAVQAWSKDYPQYLYLFLEGGVLMGGPLRTRLALDA